MFNSACLLVRFEGIHLDTFNLAQFTGGYCRS